MPGRTSNRYSKFANIRKMHSTSGPVPTRAVLYLRTSTIEQKSSIDEQEALCRAYCAAHSMTVVGVCKEHESGRRNDRPELARALSSLHSGVADALVVARIDRLSRNMNKVGLLCSDFKRNGWFLVSADPSQPELSDGSAFGQLMVHFLAVMAQYMVERSNETVAANFAYRRKIGLATGHLWGFTHGGPARMRTYAPATDGSHEKLVNLLMHLDALPLDEYERTSYRSLCVKFGIALPNGDLDAKKVKRVWELWIKGRYKPLVPAAHVRHWQRIHDDFCKGQDVLDGGPPVGAKTRVAARRVSGGADQPQTAVPVAVEAGRVNP